MGIESKDIILENSSRNTMENAQESPAILLKNDISQKLLTYHFSRPHEKSKVLFQ